MTALSNQLYTLIVSDLGVVVYHLVLTFSVVGALLAALSARRGSDRSQWLRLVFALGLLLLLRLGFLVVSFLAGQDLILGGEFLPLVDRTVSLLSLLVVTWIWVFPAPRRAADASALLLALLLITQAVFTAIWWAGEPPLAGFNDSLGDRLLDFTCLALLALGLILLITRRPSAWFIAVFMLLVLSTGQFIDLLFPPPAGDYPAAVRLSQVIAYPLLLVLPFRLRPGLDPVASLSASSPGGPVDFSSVQSPLAAFESDPRLNDLFNLLTASSYDQVCKLATRFVADLMGADVCLWVLRAGDHYQVHCAYDQVAGVHLPGLVLYPQQFPLIVNALDESGPIRLPSRTASPDITNLARFYAFERLGHVLVVPAPSFSEDSFTALALLSTFSDHPWSQQESQELGYLCHHLAQFLHHNLQVSGGRVDLIQARQQLAELEVSRHRLQLENRKLQELIDLIARHVDQGRASVDRLLETDQEQGSRIFSDLQAELLDIRQLVVLARQLPSVEESELYNEELRHARQKLALLNAALAESETTIHELKTRSGEPSSPAQASLELLGIAHDLRQATATIIEYAQLLLAESFAELEPIQRKFLRQVVENANRQSRLLGEWVVQVSQAEQGSFTPAQPLEIDPIIQRALADSEPQFREKDIDLALDIPPALPPLYLDQDALRVILTNLFQKLGAVLPVNASARVDVSQESLETGGAYLLVRISGGEPDVEPGLPDFLLEPSPADAWDSQDDLSRDGFIVVRDLVAELDGIFEVAGEPGYGGVIHLYLPLHRPEPVNHLEPSE